MLNFGMAPHLSRMATQIRTDVHLEETRKLHATFNKSEQVQDVSVSEVQQFPVPEPLPCLIWKKIVQDDYVEFEKLYALMDRGYDHKEDPKMLIDGFAIVRVKVPLSTEAKWIRVFSAWEAGVRVLFPHCVTELQSDCQVVLELFWVMPGSLQLTIQFDDEIHDHYVKKAFHMDDCLKNNIPLLAQMFCSMVSASKSLKCAGMAPNSVAGCSDVPCHN
jgi:hypothetical protein